MTNGKRNGYYADWGTFNHYEQYNDRVVYYADFMHTGNHTVVYKVRATNSGIFKLPSMQGGGDVQSRGVWHYVLYQRCSGAMIAMKPLLTPGMQAP